MTFARTTPFIALALLLTRILIGPVHAQSPLPVPSSPAEPTAAAPVAPLADPLGRETPAGLITGFLAAIKEENFERAAQYLDLSKDPGAWGPSLARQLQRILDRAGSINSRLRLSTEPIGHQDDGLMPDQERIGSIRTQFGEVDLLADRVAAKTGRVWLISSVTISRVPFLSKFVAESLIDKYIPEKLNGSMIGGAPVGHWLALVALAVASYVGIWLSTTFAWLAVTWCLRRTEDTRLRRVLKASALPIRVYLTLVVTWFAANAIGVSIVARQLFETVGEVLGWIALAWIFWRVVDALSDYSVERMTLRGNFSVVSGIAFVRRSVKAAVIAIAAIATLDALGFNVTTGLAALGIGGIAIALGAQKTIEHLVGSLTIVADQPVRVGDFCKFGDTMGTIEDIGIRSTRVRTLDRTVVTVPNGNFASMQIENFTRRDRFWFHPILDLRYETTPDQMRELLTRVRLMLKEHEQVSSHPARVRLIGLGENALRVEVFAYVLARDYDHFLEVQEDLTLRIMDIVQEVGTGFAFGSQTIYMARDRGIAGHPASATSKNIGQGLAKIASVRS